MRKSVFTFFVVLAFLAALGPGFVLDVRIHRQATSLTASPGAGR